MDSFEGGKMTAMRYGTAIAGIAANSLIKGTVWQWKQMVSDLRIISPSSNWLDYSAQLTWGIK